MSVHKRHVLLPVIGNDIVFSCADVIADMHVGLWAFKFRHPLSETFQTELLIDRSGQTSAHSQTGKTMLSEQI